MPGNRQDNRPYPYSMYPSLSICITISEYLCICEHFPYVPNTMYTSLFTALMQQCIHYLLFRLLNTAGQLTVNALIVQVNISAVP